MTASPGTAGLIILVLFVGRKLNR